MIRELTMFETRDGELHPDEYIAKKHIVTQLYNFVGPIIDTTKIGVVDRLKVVDALVGDVERARQLQGILNTWLGED